MLHCHGDRHTVKHLWMKDGRPLKSLPPSLIIEPGGGLMVHNATHSDSGVYTCEVSNDHWSNSASCMVVVTGPLLSCAGERVRAECERERRKRKRVYRNEGM